MGDWERTVVLVGGTGNGKSATGNSILGRKTFESRMSSSGVTKTCEMHRTVLQDDLIMNVIDTPGLFDFSASSDFVGKEIGKCIEMAKDGIDAILVVFSISTRFSPEEQAAIRNWQSLFGSKIIDYMIVVFTGGDELENDEKTFEEYLSQDCPEPLKEIIIQCEIRCVLFDNKTKDVTKRTKQVGELLSLVNSVIVKNGGQPCTNEILAKMKKGATEPRDQQAELDSLKEFSKREISELKKQMQNTHEELLKQITGTIEFKLRDTVTGIQQQLAEEQAARIKAFEMAQSAKIMSDSEIRKLIKEFERTQEEIEELRKNNKRGRCDIL